MGMSLFVIMVFIGIGIGASKGLFLPSSGRSSATPSPPVTVAGEQVSTKVGLFATDLVITDTHGISAPISSYSGKVLLIVNVASQCGYTQANYEAMKAMYEEYHQDGFEILAFPSNDFGQQEPGDNRFIRSYVKEHFQAPFTLMAKLESLHINEDPLFSWLCANSQDGEGHEPISWNFK